jgi:hypothetical protein
VNSGIFLKIEDCKGGSSYICRVVFYSSKYGTLLDQKRSTDVHSELKIFNLTERIEKQKGNWHEHILRMTTDRLPKVLLNYKPRGYRNIG